MSNASHTNKPRRMLVRVWVCALVLSLLTIVSVSSVGAYATAYVSRDPQVLFIDAASGKEVASTMDLFQNAYVNEKGETVVASADGTKIVAPGTSGSYEFAVRNSGGQPATYQVWAEVSQDGTTQIIPLKVDLKSGQASCENLSDQGELAPGKSALYSIAWCWPFEEGQTGEVRAASDERDTRLGDEAARRASYKVTLHMIAQAEYPAKDGGKHMPGTGDAVRPWLLLALAVLGMVLVAVGVYARRRNNRGNGRS